MPTLFADLDARVRNSPRFKAGTVAEYWRETSLGWWRPKARSYKQQEHIIFGWIRSIKPRDVLELGPGFGRITSLIPKNCKSLTLVEINRKAFWKLAKKFPHANIICADFNDYPWDKEKTCDLVVAIEVLVHVSDIPTLLKRIKVSLKRGGSVILSITPLCWYKKQRVKNPVIHRGIDDGEFEEILFEHFDLVSKQRGGKLITYWLRKK